MGSCCSSTRKKDQGYTLGGSNNNNNNNKPTTANSTGKTLSTGQVVGSAPGNGRDAMLAAAEQRKLQAENRGVQQGGGALSKKLNEERTKKLEPEQQNKEPELVWD